MTEQCAGRGPKTVAGARGAGPDVEMLRLRRGLRLSQSSSPWIRLFGDMLSKSQSGPVGRSRSRADEHRP